MYRIMINIFIVCRTRYTIEYYKKKVKSVYYSKMLAIQLKTFYSFFSTTLKK